MSTTKAGIWLACGLALFFSGGAAVEAQVVPATVIRGGTLIDGNGGPPLANSVIVVEGNRITAVGAQGAVNIPAGAQVIDAAGKFIIPGLIDGKSNWNFQYGEAYLVWGVTSAIVSGGRNDAGLADRDAINHRIFAGPRLFQAVVGLRGPGPNLNGRQGYSPGGGDITPFTPADTRRYTREIIASGADFIVLGDGNGPVDLWRPAVEEAHAAGLAVSCRCMGPQMRGLEASAIGVDVLVHAGNLGASLTSDPERWKNAGNTGRGGPEPTGASDAFATMDESKIDVAIRTLIANNTYVSPETVALDRGFYSSRKRVQEEDHAYFNDPDFRAYYSEFSLFDLWDNVRDPEEYLEPEVIAERAEGFRKKAEFMRRFVEAGGKIVAASDISQAAPGLGVHQEMAIMKEDYRMPEMKIIQAATKWNADAHRLRDVGSIEAGKFADILILNSDPLSNIMNTRDIHLVIKDGNIADRAYHADYQGRIFANSMLTDDDAPVMGLDWAAAVKDAIAARDRLPAGAPARDPRISPTPGIERIAPRTILRGSPDTIVTLRGFNFVKRSRVLVDGVPVPAEVVTHDEIRVTLSQNVLGRAGNLKIEVKNPLPTADPVWGEASNEAHVLVPFEFTTTYFSKVHDESIY